VWGEAREVYLACKREVTVLVLESEQMPSTSTLLMRAGQHFAPEQENDVRGERYAGTRTYLKALRVLEPTLKNSDNSVNLLITHERRHVPKDAIGALALTMVRVESRREALCLKRKPWTTAIKRCSSKICDGVSEFGAHRLRGFIGKCRQKCAFKRGARGLGKMVIERYARGSEG
jgi:hypothetical protein